MSVQPSLSGNEPFVTLIQAARENRTIRQKLIDILKLDPFHRTSVLHFYVETLKQKAAPEELIAAVACLLDPKVAEKAFRIILDALPDE